MSRNRRQYLPLFAVILFTSCNFFGKIAGEKTEPLPELQSEKMDSLPFFTPPPAPHCILRVKMTGCGGPCSEWEARFYDTGMSTFVDREGPRSAPFSKVEMDRLIQNARNAGFFELPDTLGVLVPGLPGWDIEIFAGAGSHATRYNHTPPALIRSFEQDLESYIFSLPWERIED